MSYAYDLERVRVALADAVKAADALATPFAAAWWIWNETETEP